jgi:hypothetical protein
VTSIKAVELSVVSALKHGDWQKKNVASDKLKRISPEFLPSFPNRAFRTDE